MESLVYEEEDRFEMENKKGEEEGGRGTTSKNRNNIKEQEQHQRTGTTSRTGTSKTRTTRSRQQQHYRQNNTQKIKSNKKQRLWREKKVKTRKTHNVLINFVEGQAEVTRSGQARSSAASTCAR